MAFSSEQDIQDWLEELIGSDRLQASIGGTEGVAAGLRDYESPLMWPTFPIDYLTRLRNLRAARTVLSSLHGLQVVSKNSKSISRTPGERLFADLLCSNAEGGRFIVVEVKSQKASAREAVTELLAYEHEILNHVPFASSTEILMVVVSRDFPTLLDHAVTGLNTWTRRNVLCLKVSDNQGAPRLEVHVPRAWEAVGQGELSGEALQIATLAFKPKDGLDKTQILAICETAAALLARDNERDGGSGFSIVVHDHLYQRLTSSPFHIIAGVINPLSFLPQAELEGFVDRESSVLAKFVLESAEHGEFSGTSGGITSRDNAAVRYLNHWGSTTWEGLSTWKRFRDIRRWRHDGLTPDRHLTPVSVDFWGVLGDYSREIVCHPARMEAFMPGLTKPGLDWRHPRIGVMLLDELAGIQLVKDGQWSFSTLLGLGIRLGRLMAITATFADAPEEKQNLMRATVFWAEADVMSAFTDVAYRYMAAMELNHAPPTWPMGLYDNSEEIVFRAEKFMKWILEEFIGTEEGDELMRAAFHTGLSSYGLFDSVMLSSEQEDAIRHQRETAVARARDWLKWTVVAVTSDKSTATDTREALLTEFGELIPLDQGKDVALGAVDRLAEDLLIDRLFEVIPELVDSWHPQLAHRLAPMATSERDWDWYQEQIRQARNRGEHYPCVVLSPGGQVGIGRVSPDDVPFIPHISDPDRQVLFADNESGAELLMAVTWDDLRQGRVPGFGRWDEDQSSPDRSGPKEDA